MRIAVLLSTYNGSSYIEEQLESLQTQSYSDFKVYIRDDGSKDDTVEKIASFCNKDDRFTFLEDNVNLGCAGSFLKLLRSVIADVYMFCDQDDVWLNNKIERVYNHFSMFNDGPSLYHSDLKVVDENLDTLHDSFMSYQNMSADNSMNKKNIFIQNFVVGCTSAINNELALKVLNVNINPNCIAMHDWWIALTARTFGDIYFDKERTILYRQHSKNVLGAKPNTLTRYLNSFFSGEGLKKVRDFRLTVSMQAESFLKTYYNDLTPETISALKSVINGIGHNASLIALLKCFVSGVNMQGVKRNCALIYSVMVDKKISKK